MKKRKITFLPKADKELMALENDPAKKKVLKSVHKALGYMETNLRHPSLNTHPFHSITGPQGEKIFEAYAQQSTPGAYRILWFYGPHEMRFQLSQ
jgi:hypothetical protein